MKQVCSRNLCATPGRDWGNLLVRKGLAAFGVRSPNSLPGGHTQFTEKVWFNTPDERQTFPLGGLTILPPLAVVRKAFRFQETTAGVPAARASFTEASITSTHRVATENREFANKSPAGRQANAPINQAHESQHCLTTR